MIGAHYANEIHVEKKKELLKRAGEFHLSSSAQEMLGNEFNSVPDVDETDLAPNFDSITCSLPVTPCQFNSEHKLPCRHMLKARLLNGEPLISSDMIEFYQNAKPYHRL